MKLNQAYLPFLQAKNRLALLYGSAGSGKSRAVAQKLIIRMTTEANHKFLIVRKVANTLYNSVYSELKTVIYDEKINDNFEFTTSPLRIVYVPNGNEIVFVGLEEVERIKSISGITGIWVEEGTEIEQADLLQLSLRLRGESSHYYQIVITFNPINEDHFLHTQYCQNPRPEHFILKTTYKDNKFLDKAYKNTLEALREQDINFYRVYCLGEWGSVNKNLVLTNWSIVTKKEYLARKQHSISTSPSRSSVGIDWGFTHASVALLVELFNDDLYILKEVYGKQLTNPEFLQQVVNKGLASFLLFADPAEPARIKEFQQYGLKIQGAKKGKDSVRHGIDFLRTKKIYIIDDCVNTIREISGWKYREDGSEEPVNFNDDTMSAMRYAVESWRPGGVAKMKAVIGYGYGVQN